MAFLKNNIKYYYTKFDANSILEYNDLSLHSNIKY